MTSPQDPWQQGHQHGGYQQYPQYPQYPQQPGYPQQGTPSGGFPQQPGYPQQPDYQQVDHSRMNLYGASSVPPQDPAAMPRPATIDAAFWIAVVVPLVATVLTVVSFVLSLDFMNSMIAAEISGLGGEQAETARNVAGVALMVGGIISAVFYTILSGLWILFGFKMRAGRNWARITLTVFAAIWLLWSVPSLITGPGGGVSMTQLPAGVEMPSSMVTLGYVQSGLGLLAMAAFLVLVYLKPSNWYFLAMRHRQGR